MRIISPYFEILNFTPDLEKTIELAGRTCYKSEMGDTDKFLRRLIDSKHESVLEHGSITVRIICDRGISHELVRHRIASFSQESTRYVGYNKDRHGAEITVIKPLFFEEGSLEWLRWKDACEEAESAYMDIINAGCSPQEGRSVLPNSLKTEIVITANPREFRLIFNLRCASSAHPQMKEIMIPLRQEFIKRWPAIFGDLT